MTALDVDHIGTVDRHREPTSLQIRLKPAWIARTLAVASALLVIANGVAYFLARRFPSRLSDSFGRLVHLDAEANLPAFFSASMLLASAGILIVIWLSTRRVSRYTRHWLFLALIFAGLAIDEASSLHERLINPMRSLLGEGGFLYLAWVVPGFLMVTVIGIAYWRFLQHLPGRTRHLMITAAALYTAGALGFEMIGGRQLGSVGRNGLYELIATVEESLEMAGVVVFIYALLGYLSMAVDKVELWTTDSRQDSGGSEPQRFRDVASF